MPGIQNDVFVIFGDIDDVQFDPELFCHPQGVVTFRLFVFTIANGMGMSFHAKSRKKVDSFDMNAVPLYDTSGEHRVESPRNERDCPALLSMD